MGQPLLPRAQLPSLSHSQRSWRCFVPFQSLLILLQPLSLIFLSLGDARAAFASLLLLVIFCQVWVWLGYFFSRCFCWFFPVFVEFCCPVWYPERCSPSPSRTNDIPITLLFIIYFPSNGDIFSPTALSCFSPILLSQPSREQWLRGSRSPPGPQQGPPSCPCPGRGCRREAVRATSLGFPRTRRGLGWAGRIFKNYF